MNKKQADIALLLNRRLQDSGVPSHITCGEANALCVKHGVVINKYKKYKNLKAYRRLDVAAYIARNGGTVDESHH